MPSLKHIPYFFGCKGFFFFQNNPKNLDPSYKILSRSLGLLRKCKTHIKAMLYRTDLDICSHLERENPVLQPNKYGICFAEIKIASTANSLYLR